MAAGAAAYDDIFHYGRALATDTLPEPNAPPGFIRWITGNADPTGRLPWPFGTTNYLVWWGTAKLAPLVGLDSGPGLSSAGPAAQPRSGGWSRSGRSRPGPRSPSRVCTGRTTTSCRSPARPSPWRSAGPTRLRFSVIAIRVRHSRRRSGDEPLSDRAVGTEPPIPARRSHFAGSHRDSRS